MRACELGDGWMIDGEREERERERRERGRERLQGGREGERVCVYVFF